MIEDNEDFDSYEDNDEFEQVETAEMKKMASQRKRFLKEQIELREITRQLNLDKQDYFEAFGE